MLHMLIRSLLSSSWLWHFLRIILSLMIWTVQRSTGQEFRSMFLSWNMSDVFPMIVVELWVFMWITTEVKCHSHHLPSRVSIINMTSLRILTLRRYVPGFYTVSFPPFNTELLGRKSFWATTLKEWVVMLLLHDNRASTKIIWNSSARDIYLFSLCIYLFIFI